MKMANLMLYATKKFSSLFNRVYGPSTNLQKVPGYEKPEVGGYVKN